jgi:hypothetical protein
MSKSSGTMSMLQKTDELGAAVPKLKFADDVAGSHVKGSD